MNELAGYVLNDLSTTSVMAGRYREANEYVREALAIFRALDHRPMLGDILGSLGMLEFVSGNPESGRRSLAEGLAISKSIGNEWTTAYNHIGLAWLEADSGRFEMALGLAEKGLAQARATGFVPFVGMALGQLVSLYFELGQPERAQEMAAELERFIEGRAMPPVWIRMSRGVIARAALERGDFEGTWSLVGPRWRDGREDYGFIEAVTSTAQSVMQAGLMLGRLDDLERMCDLLLPQLASSGAKRHEGDLLYWRGRLRMAQGDLVSAVADLARAREILERVEATVALWRVDATLAEVCEATGDHRSALEARRRAAEIVEGLAAGIVDEDLRRSFRGRPEVVRVLAAWGRPASEPA
jgi:tetratricopeptide (TPR) repeat protein